MFLNKYSQSQSSIHDPGKKINRKQVASQTHNKPETKSWLSQRILSPIDESPKQVENNFFSRRSSRRSIETTNSASCSCPSKTSFSSSSIPMTHSKINLISIVECEKIGSLNTQAESKPGSLVTSTRSWDLDISESVQNNKKDFEIKQSEEEERELVKQERRKNIREWKAKKREEDERRRYLKQVEIAEEKLKKEQEEQRSKTIVLHYNTWLETKRSEYLNKQLAKTNEAKKIALVEAEKAKQREEDCKRAYTEWLEKKLRPDPVPSYIRFERTVSLEPVMFYYPISLFPDLEIIEMKQPAKPEQKPNVNSKTNSKLERKLADNAKIMKPCGVGAIRKQKCKPEAKPKTKRQLESQKAYEDWMKAVKLRSKPKPLRIAEPQESSTIRLILLPTSSELLLARQERDNQMQEKLEACWKWVNSNFKSK